MNGGKALLERNFCHSLPVSEHHVVSHEDRGPCFRANGIVKRRLQLLYASEFTRKDLDAARTKAAVRVFSRASA